MRPSRADLLAHAHVVALPMHVRFRGVTTREAVLIEGPHGWGEFSPFVEYDDAEAAPWLASAIEAAWSGWPSPVRDRVAVNATVPAVAAGAVPGILARFDGCTTVKVKVAEPGQTLADDVARVAAVRAARPGARIRVDANGAWSPAEALTALTRLAEVTVEYAEQPCATVDELVELRRLLDRADVAVPLAADESIRKASDPLAVARTGAVDVAVVKVPPLGGVRATLAIAEQLAALGVRLVISSALDTSVGLAAGVAAAAALPTEPYASGLGTAALFAADVCDPPLLPAGGALPALAAAPTPDLVRLQAPPDRRRWWLERLERCSALLGATA